MIEKNVGKKHAYEHEYKIRQILSRRNKALIFVSERKGGSPRRDLPLAKIKFSTYLDMHLYSMNVFELWMRYIYYYLHNENVIFTNILTNLYYYRYTLTKVFTINLL